MEDLEEKEREFSEKIVKNNKCSVAFISFDLLIANEETQKLLAQNVGLLLKEILKRNKEYIHRILNLPFDGDYTSPGPMGNTEYVETPFGMFRWRRDHKKENYSREILEKEKT